MESSKARQIYLVLQGGKAMRWGCAVGKDGFRWAGLADVGRKVMWPKWTPPPRWKTFPMRTAKA